MKKLSVVVATRNEEANLGRCLKSIKELADEIVVVDENSTDKTKELAIGYGAKVYNEPHHEIFHITKQKAINYAQGEWILQLDADEVVTPKLANEIREVVKLNNEKLKERKVSDKKKERLFLRHQKLLEKRDGKIGRKTGEVVAFFVPRINIFLGKPLIYAGTYPDGVIRLFKNGKAEFPQKSVHEQIRVEGEVGWLQNHLEHYDSPNLERYFVRFNRYTDLEAVELKEKHASKSVFCFFYYSFIRPSVAFFNLYFRHLGFMNGANGFFWSLFSAFHFPIAYFKYLTNKYNNY